MATSGAYYNTAFNFTYAIAKASDPTVFFTGTFASGEVKVSKRTGSGAITTANIATLPVPGTTGLMNIALTASEMSADEVTVEFVPSAGDFGARAVSITTEPTPSDILEVASSTVSGVADFKATGFSTFDPAADTVANVTTVGSVTSAVTTDAASRTASQADVSALATSAEIAALNDIAATDIVSAGPITTLAGAVVNVDTVDVTTTNSDMRGTDGAYTGTPPTATEITDEVWDELLTGATHNIPTSAGRRLREIAEVGLYEGASVWIDTVNGTAGTDDYENGTVNNPSNNIADATTIANSVGLSRFKVAPASSFTLATGYTGFSFSSEGMWTLALGGQALNSTTIVHAEVSGTCTSADEPMFDCCGIGTVTLPACFVRNSRLESDITLTGAGTYHFEGCMSAVAGTASPSLDFGSAVGSTNVNFRHYSGGIEVRNMGQLGTDNMSLEGNGALTINANCTGGTIAVRGNFKITDNSGGAVTIVKDDDTSNIESILADTSTDGVVISTAQAQALADEVLKRSVTNTQDSADAHSLAAIILGILESSRSSTTWTIKKTTGSTFTTKTLTLDEDAEPVIGVD